MFLLNVLKCPIWEKCSIAKTFSCENLRQLLASDFNRGYIAALALVFAVLVVVLLLRLIWFFLFRKKTCSRIVIPGEDGDIVISRDAIVAATRQELESFTQFDVRKMQLFRKGRNYSLRICCTYDTDGKGVAELVQEFKPRLREVMKELFGIESLKDITLCVEHIQEKDDSGDPSTPVQVNNAHFGI